MFGSLKKISTSFHPPTQPKETNLRSPGHEFFFVRAGRPCRRVGEARAFFSTWLGLPPWGVPHAKALRPEIIECVIQWLRFCKIHPTVGRVGPNDPQKVLVVGCLFLKGNFQGRNHSQVCLQKLCLGFFWGGSSWQPKRPPPRNKALIRPY